MQNSGVIILNKPTGMSSNTAVNKVKRLIGANKAGHLGTLDPLGTGVLPVTINKATKLFDYFLDKEKTYRAVFSFGFETDTLDSEGKIINTSNIIPTKEDIQKTLNHFVGEIEQLPPKYSSKCIGGVKAYKLARNNVEFDVKPKVVNISKFELINQISEGVFLFEVTCSAGTYIRSLCRDLAYQNGTYGTMSSIIRTRCGMFDIENSYTLQEIENGEFDVLSASDTIDLEEFVLDKKYHKNLLNGIKLETKKIYCPNGDFKLFCDNEFFGIASAGEDGYLKIKVNLRSYDE